MRINPLRRTRYLSHALPLTLQRAPQLLLLRQVTTKPKPAATPDVKPGGYDKVTGGIDLTKTAATIPNGASFQIVRWGLWDHAVKI